MKLLETIYKEKYLSILYCVYVKLLKQKNNLKTNKNYKKKNIIKK